MLLLSDSLKAKICGTTISYLAHLKKQKSVESVEKLKQLECQTCEALKSRDLAFSDNQVLNKLNVTYTELRQKLNEMYNILDQKSFVKNVKKTVLFGNKCSKYFFRKVKGVAGAIRYMFKDNGQEITTDQEILSHCAVFYDNLFGCNLVPQCLLSIFSCIPSEVQLSHKDRLELEKDIELDELKTALENMKKAAAPGMDGLTVLFYITFWPVISIYLHANILHAHQVGHFSIDTRRGFQKRIIMLHL